MAQWNGQYSGRTHETRLAEAEAHLRDFIEWFSSKSELPKAAAREVQRSLAEKVVFARVHLLKAKMSIALSKPTEEALVDQELRIANLRRKVQEVEQGGVAAVLQEFRGIDL